MKLIINTDGGARGNPGPASSAFVVTSADGKTLLHTETHYLGVATNNVAEYTAVLKALEYLQKNYPKAELEFFLDSSLVVGQLGKNFKIKNQQLLVLTQQIFTLLPEFSTVDFFYVPRAENKVADNLVNECLDANQ